MTEPRKRRSLTHVGGDIEVAGDPEDAALLSRALDVKSARDDEDRDDDPARAHVHGFHTYPARMHPETASRLVHGFTRPGDTVLDPFCGSGTVLVHRSWPSRRAVGADLSALAVLLSEVQERARDRARARRAPRRRARLRRGPPFSTKRRISPAPERTRRFPPEDVAVFEPHVLLELDSRCRDGVARNPSRLGRAERSLARALGAPREALEEAGRHVGGDGAAPYGRAGYTAKLFVKKTDELTRRLAEFASLLPSPPPPPARVALDDATALRSIGARDQGIDAIITSPPYVATYDYVAHHALRMRWLELGRAPARRRA